MLNDTAAPDAPKPELAPDLYGIAVGVRSNGCVAMICAACWVMFGVMPESDEDVQRMTWGLTTHPLFFTLSSIINSESMMDNTRKIMEDKPRETWQSEMVMALLGALRGFNGAQIAMDTACIARDTLSHNKPHTLPMKEQGNESRH